MDFLTRSVLPHQPVTGSHPYMWKDWRYCMVCFLVVCCQLLLLVLLFFLVFSGCDWEEYICASQIDPGNEEETLIWWLTRCAWYHSKISNPNNFLSLHEFCMHKAFRHVLLPHITIFFILDVEFWGFHFGNIYLTHFKYCFIDLQIPENSNVHPDSSEENINHQSLRQR